MDSWRYISKPTATDITARLDDRVEPAAGGDVREPSIKPHKIPCTPSIFESEDAHG
jgi:hypothetical protein